MLLLYEYFHPWDADQFAFYRVPKRMFKNQAFRGMCTETKILYGMLLDRVDLSVRNGWIDERKRVYIIFTQHEIMESLGISNKTASKLMEELERFGLVERRWQGVGRPALLYVKNFAASRGDSPHATCNNYTPTDGDCTCHGVNKLHTNNININKTDESDIYANNSDLIVDSDYRFTITPWQQVAGDHQGESPYESIREEALWRTPR